MERKILECLKNTPSQEHILPFFWQHGEAHEELREEIEAIQNCGINEFCVESRTHEQFCEGKWWDDFGYILEEAKRRGMRVWLLDDKRFPTGYANNYIESHSELRITSLRVVYYDYAGPLGDAALFPVPLDEGESYISVVAYERKKRGNLLCGEGVELLTHIQNGLLWWDIPEGIWRIYYVIRTKKVCSPDKVNYIDMLSSESCKAMLHAVYEPHYDHFAEYFGNTFAGFFSDEPSFSNDVNNYQSVLGKEDMLIPWNDDMTGLLVERTGYTQSDILKLLPALWHEIEGKTPILRENYMEIVTKKYSENFCFMLGDWCRAHNVMYIGHMIEDMNTHQRLGYGAGHFFRALDGQDMAGIDVVLHQILPGHLDLEHTASVFGKTVDPEFFHYTLAKLASSHAHIQPLKRNRAMCEIFGAFGWAEGVPMMKYLVDHMLVNGINYFVPHAFTPKYPDYDCPPHFYAKGTNHQYSLFAELMGYTARMSHVLSDGIHQADVAVYYNAEAEWSGGMYMLQQKVCKYLAQRQIDFDIIPQDILMDADSKDGRLVVNEENYGAVIVPYSQYLPERVIESLSRLSERNVPVIFIDKMPEMMSEMQPVGARLQKCEVVSLCALDSYLSSHGYCSICLETPCKALRVYHIKRGEHHLFMFWNEDNFHEIDTNVVLPAEAKMTIYDGWKNKIFAPRQDGKKVRIKLSPCASIIVCVGDIEGEVLPYDYGDYEWREISQYWDVSICDSLEEDFTFYYEGKLKNLARELPDFAGVLRYETTLTMKENEDVRAIDIGRVGESAMLWVNGVYCGACVSTPFCFEVHEAVREGENKIRIEVANNIGYRQRDQFSRYLPLPPTGLLGPVRIG